MNFTVFLFYIDIFSYYFLRDISRGIPLETEIAESDRVHMGGGTGGRGEPE